MQEKCEQIIFHELFSEFSYDSMQINGKVKCL